MPSVNFAFFGQVVSGVDLKKSTNQKQELPMEWLANF
jgi:hypothetical protein